MNEIKLDDREKDAVHFLPLKVLDKGPPRHVAACSAHWHKILYIYIIYIIKYRNRITNA